MTRFIAGITFFLATIAEIVLIVLKCTDILPLSWLWVIVVPYALAAGITIAFRVLIWLIGIFVDICFNH